MAENTLILGSKEPPNVPNIRVTEIFSSNGSAELAEHYIKKIGKVRHTCAIGAKSFLKLNDIKSRVTKSNPDTLIIRDYEEAYSEINSLFSKDTEIIKFTKKEQFLFQRNFFNKGLMDIFSAELKYKKKLFEKISHLILCFSRDGFVGVSTGFYALLYASKKYPNANLILSGLSFEGGGHFYKTGKMTLNRGIVDNFLFYKLKKDIKKRIYTSDIDVAEKFNLKKITDI